MKVKEWNRCLKYATSVAESFGACNLNVSVEPYSMYDGRQGVCFKVKDINDRVYQTYFSGIENTESKMKGAIDRCLVRVLQENA